MRLWYSVEAMLPGERFDFWTEILSEEKEFLGAYESELQPQTRTLESHDSKELLGSNSAVTKRCFYFSSKAAAQKAFEALQQKEPGAQARVEEVLEEDWNAKWRDFFEGIELPPFWKILPTWKENAVTGSAYEILITPGMGFGTGTHPTTQMCLEAIGRHKNFLKERRVLDFGSGSGILSVAAARLGAQVRAIEIDGLAREHAKDCFQQNKVSEAIRMTESLEEGDTAFDFVVANILSSTLREFCEPLLSCIKAENSFLILSGILEEESTELLEFYAQMLSKNGFTIAQQQIHRREAWVAIEIGVR